VHRARAIRQRGRMIRRASSFGGLRSPEFAEAESGAAAVLFEEFDARQLKRPSEHRKGRVTRYRPLTLKYHSAHERLV
jgi:hypothetical protein